jgi:hypothetical protein
VVGLHAVTDRFGTWLRLAGEPAARA